MEVAYFKSFADCFNAIFEEQLPIFMEKCLCAFQFIGWISGRKQAAAIPV